MRPEVICHIMSSVDGRLLPSRWTQPFNGIAPSELFAEYADIGRQLSTDAWMFGKTTTAEFFPEKFRPTSERHTQAGTVHIGNRESERLFITVDPDADILYTSERLRGDNIVCILGANATIDYIDTLRQKGISYIVLADAYNLSEAMEVLYDKFGVRRISLQGGGIIDGAMLKAGLLTELSLVIYPGIDGLASAPSIFEYLGAENSQPAAGQSLELLKTETRAHGIVRLHYKFHHT